MQTIKKSKSDQFSLRYEFLSKINPYAIAFYKASIVKKIVKNISI